MSPRRWRPAAPHLGDAERIKLQKHYLGNLTWQQACDAIGVDFALLPRTTADLASGA